METLYIFVMVFVVLIVGLSLLYLLVGADNASDVRRQVQSTLNLVNAVPLELMTHSVFAGKDLPPDLCDNVTVYSNVKDCMANLPSGSMYAIVQYANGGVKLCRLKEAQMLKFSLVENAMSNVYLPADAFENFDSKVNYKMDAVSKPLYFKYGMLSSDAMRQCYADSQCDYITHWKHGGATVPPLAYSFHKASETDRQLSNNDYDIYLKRK